MKNLWLKMTICGQRRSFKFKFTIPISCSVYGTLSYFSDVSCTWDNRWEHKCMSIDLDHCVMMYIEIEKEQKHKYEFQSQHNFRVRIRSPLNTQKCLHTYSKWKIERGNQALALSSTSRSDSTFLFQFWTRKDRADFHLNIFPKHSDRNCF